MTVIQRRGTFTGITMAVMGIAIALPFTIVHPVLPFGVLLIVFGLVMAQRQTLRLPKHPNAYLAGCLAALVLLLPTVMLVKFAEQGFDDGPFYGVPYTSNLADLSRDASLDYRNGELVVYNRQEHQPPVLAYQVNDDARWAIALDVSQHRNFEAFHLSRIEAPELAFGIWRDRLDFTATWSFGSERGRAYLWKWGQFHRFYLSW